MAGVKISNLPAIVTPALTDVFPVVQSGVTYKETFTQLLSLFSPLPLANGGTGAALTASTGGIFYSGATAGAILSGTATAGLALLSGSSAAPTWSTSAPITRVVSQVFTGNGTYTPASGMVYCIAECVGGGGGGGGCGASGVNELALGGGGGGGSYAIGIFTLSQIKGAGTVAEVKIGAAGTAGANTGGTGGTGGTTTLIANNGAGSTLLSAAGGVGGIGNTTGAAQATQGGAGGVSTVGGTLIPGGAGGSAVGVVNNGISGFGGASRLSGSVGGNAINNASVIGTTGLTYGGGGSGGGNANASGAQTGGAGAAGYMRITEFISI